MFKTGATLTHLLDRGLWQTVQPLVWSSPAMTVTVPIGFTTDLASVPRTLWWLIPRADRHIVEPSVIHDFMYSGGMPGVTRKLADRTLRAAVLWCGAPRWYATAVYCAVRLFGRGHWSGK